MAQKFVVKSSDVNNVEHTVSAYVHKVTRTSTPQRMQAKVLKSGVVFGHLNYRGKKIKRSSSAPAMLQFMKSIQKSKLDPYSVVSNNLALESRKSMERLRALVGGVEKQSE